VLQQRRVRRERGSRTLQRARIIKRAGLGFGKAGGRGGGASARTPAASRHPQRRPLARRAHLLAGNPNRPSPGPTRPYLSATKAQHCSRPPACHQRHRRRRAAAAPLRRRLKVCEVRPARRARCRQVGRDHRPRRRRRHLRVCCCCRTAWLFCCRRCCRRRTRRGGVRAGARERPRWRRRDPRAALPGHLKQAAGAPVKARQRRRRRPSCGPCRRCTCGAAEGRRGPRRARPRAARLVARRRRAARLGRQLWRRAPGRAARLRARVGRRRGQQQHATGRVAVCGPRWLACSGPRVPLPGPPPPCVLGPARGTHLMWARPGNACSAASANTLNTPKAPACCASRAARPASASGDAMRCGRRGGRRARARRNGAPGAAGRGVQQAPLARRLRRCFGFTPAPRQPGTSRQGGQIDRVLAFGASKTSAARLCKMAKVLAMTRDRGGGSSLPHAGVAAGGGATVPLVPRRR
jgi:hypothetical protein